MSMEPLEKHDIQGLVLKGYGRMAATRYAVLRIDDPARAKVWLARVSGEVSDGDHRARVTALNLAFGYHGLKALGLRDENLRQFAREFRDRGVRVNAVAPGTMKTADNLAQMKDANVRWVELDQLVTAVLFLASDDAQAVTGEILPVAGDV